MKLSVMQRISLMSAFCVGSIPSTIRSKLPKKKTELDLYKLNKAEEKRKRKANKRMGK